jgi:hypothetical protein
MPRGDKLVAETLGFFQSPSLLLPRNATSNAGRLNHQDPVDMQELVSRDTEKSKGDGCANNQTRD